MASSLNIGIYLFVFIDSLLLFVTLLLLQRMRKIKPFKLADVTRILNPDERQKMLSGAVNRILAAESELTALWRLNIELP